MSLVLIRQKARELQSQRRRQLFGTASVPLVIAFFYAFCIRQFPQQRQMLNVVYALALAWSIAGLYFLNRNAPARAMPEDLGLSTGLSFCRREIQRRLNYFRCDLLWLFGPIILAIGTFLMALLAVSGAVMFAKLLPFLSLVVAWIAAYLLMRTRQQRNLKRELKELTDIESEKTR